MRNITQKWLDGLKPPAKEKLHSDSKVQGLKLRQMPNGSMTWVFVYEIGGKRRKVKLGKYPGLGLGDARIEANLLRTKLDRGKDPQAEREAEIAARKREKSVEWLIDYYIERYARLEKRTWAEDERLLLKYAFPALGSRLIAEMSREEMLKWRRSLIDSGLGVGANRAFAACRKMFNFAVDEGLLNVSPLAGLKSPRKEQEPRDRNLDWAEIEVFWKALNGLKRSSTAVLALRILLVTGQRLSEVVHAPKSEFNLEERLWRIHASRAKNKSEHVVPLSKLALRLISEAFEIKASSEWVFPSPRGSRHLVGTSVSHIITKHTEEDLTFGLPKFVAHDLRRTAATRMAELGVNHDVIAKALNHKSKGVTWIYDQYSYEPQKREAFELYGDKLAKVVGF